MLITGNWETLFAERATQRLFGSNTYELVLALQVAVEGSTLQLLYKMLVSHWAAKLVAILVAILLIRDPNPKYPRLFEVNFAYASTFQYVSCQHDAGHESKL